MSVYRKGPIELRLGDYREVLADVEPDAVITDPPYSDRTHTRHNNGVAGTHRTEGTLAPRTYQGAVVTARRPIDYAHWADADVTVFFARWGSIDGWIVPLGSDDMHPLYEAAARAAGRYAHHRIPCCIRGMTVRLCGDGPSSWAVYASPSRPRWSRKWGTLDGFYSGPSEKTPVIGGKPLWLMRALVRDYSRPGDLVCDPCAGGATTLIAAALEGRRAIGAELDPETYAKACARIERTALTPPLFHDEAPRMVQEGLHLGDEE